MIPRVARGRVRVRVSWKKKTQDMLKLRCRTKKNVEKSMYYLFKNKMYAIYFCKKSPIKARCVITGARASSEPASAAFKFTWYSPRRALSQADYVPRRALSQADGGNYPGNNMIVDSFSASGGAEMSPLSTSRQTPMRRVCLLRASTTVPVRPLSSGLAISLNNATREPTGKLRSKLLSRLPEKSPSPP
jgi:hypothetical protein